MIKAFQVRTFGLFYNMMLLWFFPPFVPLLKKKNQGRLFWNQELFPKYFCLNWMKRQENFPRKCCFKVRQCWKKIASSDICFHLDPAHQEIRISAVNCWIILDLWKANLNACMNYAGFGWNKALNGMIERRYGIISVVLISLCHKMIFLMNFQFLNHILMRTC